MNKIYKVVWNNTLQCYTVVSELAKSHTKNNASKVIKATVLSSILAVTSSTYAAQVGGVITENDLPLVIDQDITVDSINVKDNSTIENVNLVIKKDASLTVNKDLYLSGQENSYLLFEPNSTLDENNRPKYDPAGSLHVKGDGNVTNNNPKTELGLPSNGMGMITNGTILALAENTTIDGNVNIKAKEIYNYKYKIREDDDQYYYYRNQGASVGFLGNATVGKNLNVYKSRVEVSPSAEYFGSVQKNVGSHRGSFQTVIPFLP